MNFEIMQRAAHIHFIDSINCVSADACKGATFTVYNQNPWNLETLTIGTIVCGAAGACADTQFDFGGNVTIGKVECAPMACEGLKMRKWQDGLYLEMYPHFTTVIMRQPPVTAQVQV